MILVGMQIKMREFIKLSSLIIFLILKFLIVKHISNFFFCSCFRGETGLFYLTPILILLSSLFNLLYCGLRCVFQKSDLGVPNFELFVCCWKVFRRKRSQCGPSNMELERYFKFLCTGYDLKHCSGELLTTCHIWLSF